VAEPEPGQERRRAAVALRYDDAREHAPRVVASGRGATAEQIVAAAEAAGIPLREDPLLVEVLAKIDLDALIPAELYQALAEVLAWAYRQDAKRRYLGTGSRR
jgi:flagellar biosynthesis protein